MASSGGRHEEDEVTFTNHGEIASFLHQKKRVQVEEKATPNTFKEEESTFSGDEETATFPSPPRSESSEALTAESARKEKFWFIGKIPRIRGHQPQNI